MKLSQQAYKIIMEALEISKAFKVYGEGRDQHQKAVDEAIQELEAIGVY